MVSQVSFRCIFARGVFDSVMDTTMDTVMENVRKLGKSLSRNSEWIYSVATILSLSVHTLYYIKKICLQLYTYTYMYIHTNICTAHVYIHVPLRKPKSHKLKYWSSYACPEFVQRLLTFASLYLRRWYIISIIDVSDNRSHTTKIRSSTYNVYIHVYTVQVQMVALIRSV